MERWAPIFWILGISIAFFAVLMLVDYLKTKSKGKKGSR
jgi:LPS O-antigen subunit length determinant protein (WzzB/FepE family)